MEQKRELYEKFLLQKINAVEYKAQKGMIDVELDRLKQLQSIVSAETARMQLDEKTKSARTTLAQEIIGTDYLTAELVDTLIERVYVYPGSEIEIIWKMKDFCVE